ncbi:ribbon-helix-helix CopG family protein [Tamaricihabitans halophyticus]|uniref:Ribbon-helix-helix CopG family protein n=1 Tax=Tamaricihabitans halophyticus TaxID=1262583 RepID=A0A4R2QY57_9PSEU|nr:ribbon-helix-helix protein, CopG family [Tamaricihabitans halophyticus]TCP53968.1 ribbon-helix-helix CopG family protein [Tamaricihabitans halophyticus]
MKTLYLRNVPDDVVERLERLAKQEGVSSVSAIAVRELADVSWRANNLELLDALPDHNVSTESIRTDLDQERSAR